MFNKYWKKVSTRYPLEESITTILIVEGMYKKLSKIIVWSGILWVMLMVVNVVYNELLGDLMVYSIPITIISVSIVYLIIYPTIYLTIDKRKQIKKE